VRRLDSKASTSSGIYAKKGLPTNFSLKAKTIKAGMNRHKCENITAWSDRLNGQNPRWNRWEIRTKT